MCNRQGEPNLKSTPTFTETPTRVVRLRYAFADGRLITFGRARTNLRPASCYGLTGRLSE